MSEDSGEWLLHQNRPHQPEEFGFGLVGPDLRYLHANSSLAEMTGCTPESLRGRSIREAQGGWAEILEPLISSAIETGRPVPEFVLGPVVAAAGTVGPVWKGHLSMIRGSTGVVLGITLVVEPLGAGTDLQSACVLDEWGGQFDGRLEMLAHDYRNRLAPILSAAQMIRKYGSEKPEILEWAGTSIERQVREMTDDLNDLIDLARLTLGEVELHMHEVDLRPILDRMTEIVRSMGADLDLRLNMDPEPQAFAVLCDPVRLEQALQRLLRYVIKSARPKSVVEFSAKLAAGQVVIGIGDVTQSAASSESEWLFKPFVDPQGTRFTMPGGIGPGLALANQIILRHGGTLSGSDAGSDRGSAVTVHIPTSNPDADRIERSERNAP